MDQKPNLVRPTRVRPPSRRTVLKLGAAGLGASLLHCGTPSAPGRGPAVLKSGRPGLPFGVQSGDISTTSAVVWAAADRPGKMRVSWSTNDRLDGATIVAGPDITPETGLTGKLSLTGLPPGQDIFYAVTVEELASGKLTSEPARGQLRTAPTEARDIRFLWSGDTCGQGYGIDLARGGMAIYSAMLERAPDFFIHSGDTIYADNPFPEQMKLPDGSIWRNDFVTDDVAKVAETLAEFRANFRYNLNDRHLRGFNAGVAQLCQWDDHEVTNNWYPGEVLADERYRVTDVDTLSARARRAFLEWTPIAVQPERPDRVHRKFSYGPLLEVFTVDMRSFRNANSKNQQPGGGAFMGAEQVTWLQQSLASSQATWKVVAADMPIGIVVEDDAHIENCANSDGPPLGRELEMAGLLRAIRDNDVRNVVWLTADVHYTAAHYYDPGKAQFTEFSPFYEFISGPLNAGSFGPNELDNTFGPQVLFQKTPSPEQQNASPAAGMQFFGEVQISAATRAMTVHLRDLTGAILFSQEIAAT